MILLRNGLNDSIFHLELSACWTKQFILSRPFHSRSWNLCHREKNKVPVPPALSDLYNWCQIQRPHFSGAHPPSATLSGDVSYGKPKAGSGMFHYLIVLLGWPRKSFWVWLDYPDHVSVLLDSNCQHVCKKKNQSNAFPFRSAQGQIIVFANFSLH